MKNIIIIVLLSFFIKSYGQVEIDTMRFNKIQTKTIESIESLEMKIIDTLVKPKSYILGREGNPVAISIKKGNKYVVFDLLPDSGYGAITDMERIQVNGKNYKELVIYCDNTYGHSGLGGGLRITNKRVIIYDLKKITKIFDAEYFNSTYQWVNDVSEDLEIMSTTSEYLDIYNFEVIIKNKSITLKLGESEDIDPSDFIATIWKYELHNNMFIGKAYK